MLMLMMIKRMSTHCLVSGCGLFCGLCSGLFALYSVHSVFKLQTQLSFDLDTWLRIHSGFIQTLAMWPLVWPWPTFLLHNPSRMFLNSGSVTSCLTLTYISVSQSIQMHSSSGSVTSCLILVHISVSESIQDVFKLHCWSQRDCAILQTQWVSQQCVTGLWCSFISKLKLFCLLLNCLFRTTQVSR